MRSRLLFSSDGAAVEAKCMTLMIGGVRVHPACDPSPDGDVDPKREPDPRLVSNSRVWLNSLDRSGGWNIEESDSSVAIASKADQSIRRLGTKRVLACLFRSAEAAHVVADFQAYPAHGWVGRGNGPAKKAEGTVTMAIGDIVDKAKDKLDDLTSSGQSDSEKAEEHASQAGNEAKQDASRMTESAGNAADEAKKAADHAAESASNQMNKRS